MGDVSVTQLVRPAPLRVASFLSTAVGAALVGVGAVVTWITVGLRAFATNTDTVIPGTDLPDGLAALACACAMLIGIAISRSARGRRTWLAGASIVLGASALASGIGIAFLLFGADRGIVLDVLSVPRELWGELEVFRDVGAGPWLVTIGGVAGVAGATLELARAPWSRARPSAEVGAQPLA